MDFPWTEILSGVGGGLAGLIIAAVLLGRTVAEKFADGATKLVESRLRRVEERDRLTFAFASSVDIDLRTRRIEVYGELLEKTGLLRCGRGTARSSTATCSSSPGIFRDWYFKRGGLFLSEGARDAYFDVQKTINAILADGRSGPVGEADYSALREKCSALRTELAERRSLPPRTPESPSVGWRLKSVARADTRNSPDALVRHHVCVGCAYALRELPLRSPPPGVTRHRVSRGARTFSPPAPKPRRRRPPSHLARIRVGRLLAKHGSEQLTISLLNSGLDCAD